MSHRLASPGRHDRGVGALLGLVFLASAYGAACQGKRPPISSWGSGGAEAGGTLGSGGGIGGVSTGGSLGLGGDAGVGGALGSGGAVVNAGLIGAPLIVAPTEESFGINAVYVGGDPGLLTAHVRLEGSEDEWLDAGAPTVRAPDLAEWLVAGLAAGERYEYEVIEGMSETSRVLYQGSAATQARRGQAFRFALITDSHIPPPDTPIMPNVTGTMFNQELTLFEIAGNVISDKPDFIANLGDMLDYHKFGFNDPPPTPGQSREAYLNYRRLLSDALGNAAHFPVIGNWDGENGDFSPEEIERSRSQRLLYAPGPTPDTYPESGHEDQDYYAFQWGDALFVVLNVMTYTPTPHLLSYDPVGVPDDWTLGEEQMAFLEETLSEATSRWRFLLIHHAVGGAAGTPNDSAYGRGGGQAARVGEQSKVHDLMLTHGVQVFFYGHDHVFTDMVVDGIHYTLPGSAGAPWKFDALYTGYDQYWTDSGHARVDVNPDRMKVEFIAQNRTVLFSYELDNPNQ